jgi:hypothetical protein
MTVWLWGRTYVLLRKGSEPGYFAFRIAPEWEGLGD